MPCSRRIVPGTLGVSILALLGLAAYFGGRDPVHAGAADSIEPGMSSEQVLAILGRPADLSYSSLCSGGPHREWQPETQVWYGRSGELRVSYGEDRRVRETSFTSRPGVWSQVRRMFGLEPRPDATFTTIDLNPESIEKDQDIRYLGDDSR